MKLRTLIVVVPVLIMFSFSSFAAEGPSAKIISLAGEVRYKNPSDQDWQAAQVGSELLEKARVFVGPDSQCDIGMGDGYKAVTQIKEDSSIVLTSLTGEARVDISSGRMLSLIKGLDRTNSVFKVATPTSVATVRGTAFGVSVEGIGSEMDTTCEVFESKVGLSPLDKPDQEFLVEEGKGAVMGADGQIEKEFELPPDVMQQGLDFVREAYTNIGQDPETGDKPQADAGSDSEDPDSKKDEGEDKNASVPPSPPTPPTGGGPDDPGAGPDGPSGPSAMMMPPDENARMDGAVDKMAMDMAHDSEMAHTDKFSGAVIHDMAGNLYEMNYGAPGMDGSEGTAGPGPGNFNPEAFSDSIKNAIEQSDYFLNQPPEIQQQMTTQMDNYFQHFTDSYNNGTYTGGPMEGGPMVGGPMDGGPMGGPGSMPGSEGPGGFTGGTMAMPDGGAFNTGTEPFGPGTFDPNTFMPPASDFAINPNDLASFINNDTTHSPAELHSMINFIQALREHYHDYVTANGNDAGYFNSPKVVQNFNYVKDNVPYTGSIVFTPTEIDSHTDGSYLHATSVLIKDDVGGNGNVVVNPTQNAPGNIVEVKLN